MQIGRFCNTPPQLYRSSTKKILILSYAHTGWAKKRHTQIFFRKMIKNRQVCIIFGQSVIYVFYKIVFFFSKINNFFIVKSYMVRCFLLLHDLYLFKCFFLQSPPLTTHTCSKDAVDFWHTFYYDIKPFFFCKGYFFLSLLRQYKTCKILWIKCLINTWELLKCFNSRSF